MVAITLILLTLVYFEFSFIWLSLIILIAIRVFFLRQRKLLLLWIVLAVIWLGWLTCWNKAQLANRLQHNEQLLDQHIIVAPDEIQVDGDLVKFKGRWQEKNQRIQGYYRLQSLSEKSKWLHQAQTADLTVSGDFSSVSGPTNENQFDYQRYLGSQRIVNQVFVKKMVLKSHINSTTLTDLIAWLHELRWQLLKQLDQLDNPLKSYGQLLLLGYYNADYDQQIQQINQLGLLYLFSLSGMHVFYLLRVIRWLFTYLKITRETYEWFCLLLLPIYAVLGGLSASLLRAVLMSWLIIFFQRLKLRLSGVTAECLVLIVNLAYSPLLLFSLGFQLSYLLTFILLENKNLNQIKLGIKLNCYSLPLILWHTYQWNLLTGLLTIAIMPIFDWLIVPTVVCGTLLPFTAVIANYFLNLVVMVFDLLTKLPFVITFGKPPLILVVGTIIILNILEFSRKKQLLWSVIIAAYLITGSMIRLPLKDEVVYFDIGQGDCTLIRRKFNQALTLVDTGGKVSFNHEKWRQRHSKTNGETVVANYLLSKGITKIDNLFLTHQDADHTANFDSIAHKIKIQRVLVPDGMQKVSSFIRRRRQAEVMPNQVLAISTEKYHQVAGLTLLHPFGSGKGTNEDSLTLWFKLAGVSFIISGDLDQAGEKEIIQQHPNLRVNVLKTGHHGSKTSTAASYVSQLNPKLAIISAGKNNRYGHPNRETLSTLKRFDVPYICTAEAGMIKLYPAKDKITVWTVDDY